MKCVCLLILLTATVYSQAQNVPDTVTPVVGKPMPDFTIRNIAYYPKKQAKLKDFKGRWLLLDFWSPGCGACIWGFNSKNEIQKELGDKVQVMLVGLQDPENKIKSSYATYRSKMDLVLPCSFDSLLFNRLDLGALPYIVLIDPDGIVQAVTGGLNKKAMQEFLAGGHPELSKALNAHQNEENVTSNKAHLIPYDQRKPFLVNGNGAEETDFVFRSVLSKWDPEKHFENFFPLTDFDEKNLQGSGTFQVLGVPLEWLYKFAWLGKLWWSSLDSGLYGKYSPAIIYKTKDSNDFKWNDLGSKKYSYSLIMPKEKCNLQAVQQILQRDLLVYFDYNVNFETRIFPIYKLIADPSAIKKLSKTIDPSSIKWIKAACPSFIKKPFPEVFFWISEYTKNTSGLFVEDATGITGNVNMKLDCIEANIKGVIQNLEEYGLHLIPAQKEMKVLVISDRNH